VLPVTASPISAERSDGNRTRRGLQPAAIETPLGSSPEDAGRRTNNSIEPPIGEAVRSPFLHGEGGW
jgi:hypothetical protein